MGFGLMIGVAFGLAAPLLLRRLHAWREARALSEWDPY